MKGPKTLRRTAAVLPLAVLLVGVQLAVPAVAGTRIKTGSYSGKTTQEAISPGFRKIQFTVKNGKVTITTEPSVAFGECISAPVFTLDGTSSTKLGRKRTFTLTHTFFGSKIDKIHGTFVSSNEIQGYAIYHFDSQDLCSAGKSKVNFTAKHK